MILELIKLAVITVALSLFALVFVFYILIPIINRFIKDESRKLPKENMNARQKKTLELVNYFAAKYNVAERPYIFDLGVENILSKNMKLWYDTKNTPDNVDFHKSQDSIKVLSGKSNITTSFEVFEHLLNPFTVLRAIRSEYLVCTVPLKVWFSPAYWHKTDVRDRHFHEFEERQFLWLLEETGWGVLEKGKWKIQHNIGIRPFLRLFWPSYLWVIAKRNETQFKHIENGADFVYSPSIKKQE